jgi:hypothetical protein
MNNNTECPTHKQISSAISELTDLQRQYDQTLERHRKEVAALKELIHDAAVSVSGIDDFQSRLQVVSYAYHNTSALKKDLSFALFGDERHEYHMRKLIKPLYRECNGCGHIVFSGHEFEYRQFYCAPCKSAKIVEAQKRDNEYAQGEKQRQERYLALKKKYKLIELEQKELSELLFYERAW